MAPLVVRWGILGPGGVARRFVNELLIDPKTRRVDDIVHAVTAVASSSSFDRAKTFVTAVVGTGRQSASCHAYGSYEELLQSPDVDLVYVATTHTLHFQTCMLCLEAGKGVLCEKPLTVNAAQARILYRTAREKNVFLLDGVWTRFLPISAAIRKHVADGDIGEVLRITTDISYGCDPEKIFPYPHRLSNMDLAGGAFLDLGIYALTWIFQTLYHTLSADQQQPPKVVGAAMTINPETGVDESTVAILEFEQSTPKGNSKAHATLATAFRVGSETGSLDCQAPAAKIQGDKGEIHVFGPLYCPQRYRIILRIPGERFKFDEKMFDLSDRRSGMFFEADESARCWRDRKIESPVLPFHESLLIMKTMDEIRKIGGMAYSDAIESADYVSKS